MTDDLQARCLAIAAAERAKHPKKYENRAKYPEFTAWVDDYRAVFGAELVKVIYPDGKTWTATKS